MSAEYSLEEVRAVAEAIAVRGGHFSPIAENMLTAYAERIKADESAVPFGYAYRYADGIKLGGGGRERNGMRPTEAIPLFVHPPAHAAQVEHQCRSCMAKDYGLQPTAEPVAQEGPDGEDGPWAEGWAERSGTKESSTAQPSAVPAERRVVVDSALIPRHYASNIGYAACMMESSQSVLDRREAPILRKIAALLAAAPSPEVRS